MLARLGLPCGCVASSSQRGAAPAVRGDRPASDTHSQVQRDPHRRDVARTSPCPRAIHFIVPRVCVEPGKCPDTRPGWWYERRGLGRRSVRGSCRGEIRTGGESDGHVLPLKDKIRDGVPKIGSGTAITSAHRGSTTPSRTPRSSVDGAGRATEWIAPRSGWRREAEDDDADGPVGPSIRSPSGMIVRID